MADERLNENSGPGMTTWNPTRYGDLSNLYTTGYMAKIFGKFFSTEAKRKNAIKGDPRNVEGDLLVNPNSPVVDLGQPGMSYSKGLPFMPEAELNRKRRYDEFEKMDEYPEITAALDIYADESTQKDLRNKRWIVKSDSEEVIREIENLFKRVRLDHIYWDIVRGTCKYGDSFIEVVANANAMDQGIRKIKVLNPYYILRIEDKFGQLKTFLQEIPERQVNQGDWMNSNSKYLELDKNQIVHFRLHTSDPKYYPYGRSIMSGAIRVYRSLKLMEDAMIVYRLSRAPERRIFYVDVGNLPSGKAEQFMETMKMRFKKEKYANQNRVDSRHNPLAVDEDFFIPIRGNQGTKVDTLKGAENLGEVDDVKYFRDKLLATLKVPKDYIVEYDKSAERKANLDQLDVKFARVIQRVIQSVSQGFTLIARRHLEMIGYPKSQIHSMEVVLPDGSDIFIKRKMAVDAQKAEVITNVMATGLFPKSYIYKEFYDMTDTEIEMLMAEAEKEQEEQMQREADMMAQQQQATAAGQMQQTQVQGQTDMEVSNNQAQNDMKVSDNDAKNSVKVEKSKPKPKPAAKAKKKNEELQSLRNQVILEEGASSPRAKALSRILDKYDS
jgi:hypothetical protein